MKALVFGSLNIDYTYRVDHMVNIGETLTSKNLSVNAGGKGLNQAIALSKSGMDVYLAGQIGHDGLFLMEIAKTYHVNTDYIKEVDTHTGNAIIQVNNEGNNCILLYPGANREIEKCYIDEVLSHFEKDDYIILQNEINHLDYIIDVAYNKGMIVCLNPSPYDGFIEACDLNKVSYLFLNEVEGEMMTHVKDENEIIETLKQRYPKMHIILTLGEKGSIYKDAKYEYRQPAIASEVVDTTGAGDTFSSYFLSQVMHHQSIDQAMSLAATASSITISRKGASKSIPTIDEVI